MQAIISDGIEYRRYDHLYFVSSCGKFLRNGVRVEPKLRPDGYLSIGRKQLAHRLVAKVWINAQSDAMHVHHINGIKHDNRAENLEWVTPKQHFSEYHSNSLGHKMSEEGKIRLREIRLGSKTSEETKQKQREASIRLGCRPPSRPFGYKMSDDSLAKCRANNPKNTACTVKGIPYRSFSEAGRALGEKPHTVRKRCLSANFPDYQLKNSAT